MAEIAVNDAYVEAGKQGITEAKDIFVSDYIKAIGEDYPEVAPPADKLIQQMSDGTLNRASLAQRASRAADKLKNLVAETKRLASVADELKHEIRLLSGGMAAAAASKEIGQLETLSSRLASEAKAFIHGIPRPDHFHGFSKTMNSMTAFWAEESRLLSKAMTEASASLRTFWAEATSSTRTARSMARAMQTTTRSLKVLRKAIAVARRIKVTSRAGPDAFSDRWPLRPAPWPCAAASGWSGAAAA